MNILKVFGWIALFLFAGSLQAKKIEIIDIRCENQECPMGVQTLKPTFSWKLLGDTRNLTQVGYRILVSDNEDLLKKDIGNIWDSGRCNSEISINILFGGKKLLSAARYYWKVQVWDNQGVQSKWSEIKSFQMGLMKQEDWAPARWIAMESVSPKDVVYPGFQLAGNKVDYLEKEARMPQFRKPFQVETKKIQSATVFISGLGHFELSLNGKKVGDHFLDPGWSKYDKSSLYVTFDVTDQLLSGENVLGVRLGNGFLHVPRDSTRYRKLISTFSFPKMICKVHITYADGTTNDINSDHSWKVTQSPITFSSIYGGEDYDATLEQRGWDTSDFNDISWINATEIFAVGNLSSQISMPLKVKKQLRSISVRETHPGIYIYDFGQNASAIIALKVKGKFGAKVVMKPAEYLTKDGLANQNNSGTPYWFSYTLSGNGTENWSPSFSYYGFRYVQVEGAVPIGVKNPQGLPVIEDLSLLHISNTSEEVGQFACSSSVFNNIYSLIDWSVKSNMSHVLTDCPHREKLGWLEVAHLMSSSIAYCYDIKQMYTKIVNDMKDSQLENGLIPNTAPEYASFPHDFRDSPEWGSAGVILPWFLYRWYGDLSVLEENYHLMVSYVDYLTSRCKYHILYHGLGDWYDLGPNHPGYSQLTTRGLTPTALYYYNLNILAETSKLLNKELEYHKYTELATKVKIAFNAKFFNVEKGYYDRGSQTANAIALYMNLVNGEDRESCLKQIIADIHNRDNSITAGDIGFRYLLRVLEMEGASDVIYDMNSQSDKPGYGYQLKQGATSLTESWAALQTASHNHCMLGHLMEWFYSGIGGVRADKESVAFKKFILHPEMVGNIYWADVSFKSPYGEIKSKWEIKDTSFVYKVTVPVNTTAWVYLPGVDVELIQESGKPIKEKADIQFIRVENGRSIYEIGSGDYSFSISPY